MNPTRKSADHHLMRTINRALILNHLRLAAPQSRAELAARTGLTRSTVSSLVDELIAANLVHETGTAPSRGGRPGTMLALNPAGGCAIGVEITSHTAVVLLTDFTARPRWQRQITFEPGEAEEVLPNVEKLVDEALRHNAQTDNAPPLGIGLGTAGLVQAQEGMLRSATNLGWRDVPFKARWEQRFRLPVRVGNEASIAALGEHYFGAAADTTDFIYLGISRHAIGAGIFTGGKLYQGIDGYAGEAGHVVIDPAGALCSCGRRGCWEAVLREACDLMPVREALKSGVASTLQTQDKGHPDDLTFTAVLRAAQNRDALATGFVQGIIGVLSTGIANLINLFNPQLVVLGGSLGLALEPFLPAIERAIAEQIILPPESMPQLAPSQIAPNACAQGAVALVLDDIMSEPVA